MRAKSFHKYGTSDLTPNGGTNTGTGLLVMGNRFPFFVFNRWLNSTSIVADLGISDKSLKAKVGDFIVGDPQS